MQGLADTFILLGMPFDSPEAKQLNKEIFETIYFSALETSCTLSRKEGSASASLSMATKGEKGWADTDKLLDNAGPYATYEGSPVSKGVLQHDMWGVKPPSQRWDWDALRADIAKHGVRNSLLLAPMPTASTSQVRQCYLPTRLRIAFNCPTAALMMRLIHMKWLCTADPRQQRML